MLINSHNLKGSSTHIGNSAPRWRAVFTALTLALTIGGTASQASLARAAPNAAKWQLYMAITGDPSDPICVGDKVELTVQILGDKVDDSETAPLTPKIKLLGISVIGGILGDQIGTLSPQSAVISAQNDPPDSARFTFVANSAGTLRLLFNAKVKTSWFGPFSSPKSGTVEQYVDVTIIPCEYKVKTILGFNPGIYNIRVISDEALMKRDETGTFTGSSTMHWVYSNFSIPCTISAGDTSVDMTGRLADDGGQFVGTLTFGAATPVGCRGSGGGTVNPLQFMVASSGGVSKSTATASPLSGPATIIVIPQENKTGAFLPGDYQAGWDDFSSLFRTMTMLALY